MVNDISKVKKLVSRGCRDGSVIKSRQLTTMYNTNSRRSSALFWLPRELVHMWFIHIQGEIHTYT